MKLKKSLIFLTAFLTALTTAPAAVYTDAAFVKAADQFDQGTKDGYDWEMWNQDYTGEVSMQIGSNGIYNCSWDGVKSCIFSSGRKLGSTKSWQDYDWLMVQYEADYTPKGGSSMYIHGWSEDPLVEYYIVEAWGNWRPPGSSNAIADITADGKDYDVYSVKRNNQPSIEGTKSFEQYWSVQKTNPVEVNHKNTLKGIVSLTKHFAEWEKVGMDVGKIYEITLSVEGYHSSGEAQIRKNLITEYIPHPDYQNPPIIIEPPAIEGTEPSGSGSGVTDDFEGSGTSWTGRGDGVSVMMATSFKNAGSKSLCVTGRTESWQGFQCSSSELRAGGTYEISMDVGYQDPNYNTTGFIAGVQYESAGIMVYDDIDYVKCRKNKWAALSGSFSIPDDAENIMLYVYTEYTDPPVTAKPINFFIDNVKLTDVSSAATPDVTTTSGSHTPTPVTTTTPAVTTTTTVPAATTVLTTTTAPAATTKITTTTAPAATTKLTTTTAPAATTKLTTTTVSAATTVLTTTTASAVTTTPFTTTAPDVNTTLAATTADSAATSPAEQTKTIYGDADQDGKVDLSDLKAFTVSSS